MTKLSNVFRNALSQHFTKREYYNESVSKVGDAQTYIIIVYKKGNYKKFFLLNQGHARVQAGGLLSKRSYLIYETNNIMHYACDIWIFNAENCKQEDKQRKT